MVQKLEFTSFVVCADLFQNNFSIKLFQGHSENQCQTV